MGVTRVLKRTAIGLLPVRKRKKVLLSPHTSPRLVGLDNVGCSGAVLTGEAPPSTDTALGSGSGEDRAPPGDDGATPGDGGATPGDDGATPGDGGVTPGGDGATPGDGGVTPGDDGATPGYEEWRSTHGVVVVVDPLLGEPKLNRKQRRQLLFGDSDRAVPNGGPTLDGESAPCAPASGTLPSADTPRDDVPHRVVVVVEDEVKKETKDDGREYVGLPGRARCLLLPDPTRPARVAFLNELYGEGEHVAEEKELPWICTVTNLPAACLAGVAGAELVTLISQFGVILDCDLKEDGDESCRCTVLYRTEEEAKRASRALNRKAWKKRELKAACSVLQAD